jgi:S-disulfanyl-L-cysteine oxidoreductase SoxD
MSRLKFLVAIAAVLAAVAVLAETRKYKLGRDATRQEVRAFDMSIAPDGKGLPAGSGDARTGRALYAAKCAMCHGQKGEGGSGSPALVGGIGTLKSKDPKLTVGSFWPYATTLYDYTNRAMPPQDPGSMTANETYAITAYILYMNGLVKEAERIDSKTLPKVVMPNREGFIPDKRPDIRSK